METIKERVKGNCRKVKEKRIETKINNKGMTKEYYVVENNERESE